jgi:hypothetical protein
MRAEKFQRPGKQVAGSRHESGGVRQTAPAEGEFIGPQPQTLMEEVLRRGASGPFSINSGLGSGPREPPCTVPYARWCGRTGEATHRSQLKP